MEKHASLKCRNVGLNVATLEKHPLWNVVTLSSMSRCWIFNSRERRDVDLFKLHNAHIFGLATFEILTLSTPFVDSPLQVHPKVFKEHFQSMLASRTLFGFSLIENLGKHCVFLILGFKVKFQSFFVPCAIFFKKRWWWGVIVRL